MTLVWLRPDASPRVARGLGAGDDLALAARHPSTKSDQAH